MPTYQYACKDCDLHFDQVQAFSDAALTVCPNCGGHLRKVYGSVGVVFKGSGFYRTDSRSGASKASLTADHKSESHSSSSGDSTSATKTDSSSAASTSSNGSTSKPAAAKTPAAVAS